MSRIVALVAGAALAVIIAGCSGGSEAAPIDGCKQVQTDQLFNPTEYDCPDGHTVFTFATNSDRDGFQKVAEGMGGHTLNSGDRWLKMDY